MGEGEDGLVWSPEGPRSARFGDVYFSMEDGLAESRAVFLAGCGLPAAWAGRRSFVVGELGFGTGLNVAALLELWARSRPEGGHLHVFSVEAFPISPQAAARALGRWPELGDAARLLIERWPSSTPGFHRVDLPELSATLDLAVMDVAEALANWQGRANAWFLDGFAPSANPEMWRGEVLRLIAERSAPGARAATFTVAGEVRRGLAAQGFSVEKRPGFGRKRERLEAVAPGEAVEAARRRSVVIIGAGIAGASVARALTALGVAPVVIEAERPASGASGNAAALVTPRLDAGGGPVARLSAQAFGRAVGLYWRAAPEALIAEGVLQLEAQGRDAARFDRIAAQPWWDGGVARLDSCASAARLGEPSAQGGLWLRDALVIEPAAAIEAWLCDVQPGRVAGFERAGEGWIVYDSEGAALAVAETVVLACGMRASAIRPELAVSPVRGQATVAEGVAPPPAAAWGGYLIPTRTGLLFGATHDRGDEVDDARAEDDGRNLATLAQVRPGLAAKLEGGPLLGRAAVRAATPDRLPLAGEVEEGLYVLGGLGSRGFAFAPILAEHVAALICGTPSPLPMEASALVDPRRFDAKSTGGDPG